MFLSELSAAREQHVGTVACPLDGRVGYPGCVAVARFMPSCTGQSQKGRERCVRARRRLRGQGGAKCSDRG